MEEEGAVRAPPVRPRVGAAGRLRADRAEGDCCLCEDAPRAEEGCHRLKAVCRTGEGTRCRLDQAESVGDDRGEIYPERAVR